MSRGDFRDVHPEHCGRHNAGVYGRCGVRKIISSPETYPNADVLQKRVDKPEGRGTVLDVQGRGHEEESHHRSACESAVDQAQDHQRGGESAVLPN